MEDGVGVGTAGLRPRFRFNLSVVQRMPKPSSDTRQHLYLSAKTMGIDRTRAPNTALSECFAFQFVQVTCIAGKAVPLLHL